ncbi:MULTISPECIES: hypothetical protein [unclassified Coleofasciculus]|uniref:hypothetical protein n=1 Tax=Coleofasciculus sp. LEGE 07081 TaxID=2777967 RepID=UPI001D152905
MNTCLCCSGNLLRHICHNRVYWYCSHCRQAMPAVERIELYFYQECELRKAQKTLLPQKLLALAH